MPKLSLYRPVKQNDYRYLDRTISQQLTVGGTDLYIHKYLGPTDQGPSIDYTQPQYDNLDPTNIQDLLFLENRDRTYDPNIYRLRGHYNVQNLDFDLSQFGLFLNNDIIFIVVHYNDMIDIIGRKLMTGDVLELPHLLDYNPLKETIPVALKRFYQITDANYASEGFSQTWYPHLWRIKCEKLVNSQEFSQILQEPINTDNYLGQWDKTKTYPPGYVITFGDKNYTSLKEVPAGLMPPDPTFWQLNVADSLKDILSTYNKNIEINDAAIKEAKRIVPLSGYDTTPLYVVPTYDPESGKINQPAPPKGVVTNNTGAPTVATGTVMMVRNPKYKIPSPVIKIPKSTVQSIWDMTADFDPTIKIDKFASTDLRLIRTTPQLTDTGSGPVQGNTYLSAESLGVLANPYSYSENGVPYGTADDTDAEADQNPVAPGFSGEVTSVMDYRADCDPRFLYIARATPKSFGYLQGYLTGDGNAPNGLPTGAGIAFPENPKLGDYFLRIDYLPQVLFRWNGFVWVRISQKVRTEYGYTEENKSLLSGFINNTSITKLTDGGTVPERQALSTILTITPDNIPPI